MWVQALIYNFCRSTCHFEKKYFNIRKATFRKKKECFDHTYSMTSFAPCYPIMFIIVCHTNVSPLTICSILAISFLESFRIVDRTGTSLALSSPFSVTNLRITFFTYSMFSICLCLSSLRWYVRISSLRTWKERQIINGAPLWLNAIKIVQCNFIT